MLRESNAKFIEGAIMDNVDGDIGSHLDLVLSIFRLMHACAIRFFFFFKLRFSFFFLSSFHVSNFPVSDSSDLPLSGLFPIILSLIYLIFVDCE